MSLLKSNARSQYQSQRHSFFLNIIIIFPRIGQSDVPEQTLERTEPLSNPVPATLLYE